MKKSYKNPISILGFTSKVAPVSSTFAFVSMILLSTGLFAQSKQQKQQIVQQSNLAKLNLLQTSYANTTVTQKQEAIQAAKKNGWKVRIEAANGGFGELQKLGPNGEPIYYVPYNVSAAKSTRANHINSGGSLGLNLDGQNMTAHVWDGGPTKPTHQEFDGAGGNNRVTIGDGVTTIVRNSNHAQHVTGTIMASGANANAKGMASQAKAKTYEWNNDKTEATNAASNGMLLSNHSYGYGAPQIPDQYFGAYIDESRDWDQIMYNAPFYLMVAAAGNDGDDNSSNAQPLDGNSSYDKLSGHSTSKNNLVVANARDANVNNDGTLNSVTINSGSSEGPTDDLRIKPDITGNGTGVYSSTTDSDSSYSSYTGTSMASPNVTGTLLLLQQHYNNINSNYMKAATLKGLALHTADDIGPSGPDAVHGWGLLNAKVAAEAITNKGTVSKIEELTLTSGQTYTVTVDSDGSSPLLASISWTDRAGTAVTATNSSTAVLVNDLDIRVTKGSTTSNPYKLTSITTNATGDNTVDPYERVDVANASGTYTITVTHKGTLTGGSQNFSLIVTGLTGTATVCTATVPTGVSSSAVGSDTATIGWTAVAGATYDVRYRQTGASSWTTVAASGTSNAITGLSATTAYEAQVRSKCADGTTSDYSTSVNFTTTDVQLNYCASNGKKTNDEYIGKVQVGTINKTSTAGSGGYSDFTAESTNLSKGGANTITITPTWPGTTYDEGYSVWIDYNQDGDFADTGEQVWTKAASKTTPVSGSFTVPATAKDGNTRMRVSMKYNGTPNPCESFDYGEVEDYTVVIGGSGGTDTQAPSAPAGLTASNVAQTTLTLSWNAATDNVGVTGYDVYQGTTNLGSVTATTRNITGLTANTAYQFTVKAKDAAGNVSAASNTLDVTTTGGSSDPCAGVDPYNSSVNYQVGDRVTFQGSLYELTSTGWNNLGACGAFFATTAFSVTATAPPFNEQLKAYPNPVSGTIINIDTHNLSSKEYVIFNILGQTVDQGTFINKINVQELKSGSYFVKVGDKTAQFVKQ
ncbi:putative secreted protein (Por secretion system target) [Aquimarina sp. MAR_2010_214]|uniref:GEVED domain-containing protein n=1 Tax=Aquimarina sp. MAR_2010_214 TaxID=1250026 RepID=UPI000C708828|nr:GEVED domain-containing protein [Aquimarina sp. MAR_2010_214]PKV49046.1 putative secreted protein (Por secretion system target) [Aquimarina sp. MAR_2010_214]